MSHASLEISPRPELVRVARMMAVSLARRSGVPDNVLDEVRIAVGEATTRAVRVHTRRGVDELVRLTFVEDARGFEVEVRDVGDVESVPPVEDPPSDVDPTPDAAGVDLESAGAEFEALPVGLDLAVIAGFADGLEVVRDPAGGTLLRLCWTR